MDIAGAQVVQEGKTKSGSLSRSSSFVPKLGLRARQVAMLTLLVATIVAVINIAYIASLTTLIIERTRDQASQLMTQIRYEIQQDLVRMDVGALKTPFQSLAKDRYSGTRRLMESQITIKGAISYLYITDE